MLKTSTGLRNWAQVSRIWMRHDWNDIPNIIPEPTRLDRSTRNLTFLKPCLSNNSVLRTVPWMFQIWILARLAPKAVLDPECWPHRNQQRKIRLWTCLIFIDSCTYLFYTPYNAFFRGHCHCAVHQPSQTAPATLAGSSTEDVEPRWFLLVIYRGAT